MNDTKANKKDIVQMNNIFSLLLLNIKDGFLA